MALSDFTTEDDKTGDGLLYVPPRSSAFRTSLYPGFWSPGSGPSINPNPVAGDNAVAAPTVGEFNYQPPAPPPEQSGLFSVTSNPTNDNDGGTSADERAANRAKEVGLAGEVTDPADALRAVSLGLSLTSPTGIAGLAATTGANLLGAPDEATDPVGALLGNPNGNPWDLKSNINLRPGYGQEYEAGIKRGLSPQGALNAARSATNPGSNVWGKSYGTQPRDPSGAAPAAPAADVTAANAKTGFGGQDAANAGAPRPASPTVAPQFNLSAPKAAPKMPGQAGFNANATGNGGGNPKGGGGGSDSWGSRGGTESRDPGSEGKFNRGGVVADGKMSPHQLAAARKNHDMLKQVAERAGLTLPALVAKMKNGNGELANRARLELHVMKMARGGVAMAEAPADGSMMYDPPAELTQGDTDTVDAKLTPGELVVTKPAAQQYRPAVKAAINNPELAGQLNDVIEDFLGMRGQETPADTEDDEAHQDDDQPGSDDGGGDDGSGMGVMANVGNRPATFVRARSGLAQITRAA